MVDQSIQTKFVSTGRELRQCLIERDEEIEAALVALVAKEHCLFVGQPGTAKTLLSDSLADWMSGERFYVLLTKFTTPEELFGPFSLSKLKADVYERLVAGYIPTAHAVVIDEIWKASSAIINTMLRVLNERRFRNGTTEVQCPLQIAIACSNEFPNDDNGGKELTAAFDRFLIRKVVNPIRSSAGLKRLLWTPSIKASLSTSITPAEIDAAAVDAAALQFTPDGVAAFESIVSECRKEGIHPGDRRLRQSVKACRAAAYVAGSVAVAPENLEILAHTLWDDPAEQPRKVGEIVGKIANPQGMAINSLLMEAQEVIGATNAQDLAQAASGTNKLKEIHAKLVKMSGPKADAAVTYVADELLRIRKEAVAKMG